MLLSPLVPYCAYLEDVTRKVRWIHFFDHAFNFSMAFDESKRPLTLFASSFLVFPYSHNSHMRTITHHKLLRVLTAYESRTRVLKDLEE